MSFQLFTASYARFAPSSGVPIQASNGAPKFPIRYELRHKAKPVYPRWKLIADGLNQEQFREAYWRDLDRVGVQKFAELFESIAKAEGDYRLVLLCFEDVSKPGQWCHRRMFANWWEQKTGDTVRELGPTLEEGDVLF